MNESIQTVNVIEITEEGMISIKSWNDDDAGNKAAEKFFADIITQKNKYIEKDKLPAFIETAIEDGSYIIGTHEYQLYLTHSQ